MRACHHDFIIESKSGHSIDVTDLGVCDYQQIFNEMLHFTEQRSADTPDQIWLVEHEPVYTQGTACQQTTLNPSSIPVIKTDRGGQITYHGPGQIVLYPLLKLKRYSIGVKTLVHTLEQSIIDLLQEYGVDAERKADAPGVYVKGAKIAALGLRIRRGFSYHGLSLNVDMNLEPFNNIDPCGYQGMPVTQLRNVLERPVEKNAVRNDLLKHFISQL